MNFASLVIALIIVALVALLILSLLRMPSEPDDENIDLSSKYLDNE